MKEGSSRLSAHFSLTRLAAGKNTAEKNKSFAEKKKSTISRKFKYGMFLYPLLHLFVLNQHSDMTFMSFPSYLGLFALLSMYNKSFQNKNKN